MSLIRCLFLGCCLLFSFIDRSYSAEISIGKFRRVGVGAYVNIIGPIRRGDSERFRGAIIQLLRQGLRVVHVRIYSPGGDVAEAIAIGRQIRSMRAQTNAPFRNLSYPGTHYCPIGTEIELLTNSFASSPDSPTHRPFCECASACFLIWSAGIGRYGETIGIHRPSYADQSWFGRLSKDQAQVAYEKVILGAQEYLREMDVPDNVIRLMFSVNSSEMYYLKEGEIIQLQNYPNSGAELFVARCGPRPKIGSPQYAAWSDCFGRNDASAEFYGGAVSYIKDFIQGKDDASRAK